ncbi:MAG TPA: protein translocase subunit SecD [Dehalococcoidales bacterium]|nr:protein translocase subunit SecD [Dehalococcoidales bacterium]
MPRKNTIVLLIILALFAFAISALVYPLFGREAMQLGLDLRGGIHMVYQADFSGIEPGKEGEAIDGAIAVIERRINIYGVTEPVIQKQGADRIMVELPGIGEAEEAKKRIGETALLEFRERVTGDNGTEEWVPATGIVNVEEKVLNSSYFKENTYVTTDQLGGVLLVFEWNSEGSRLSGEITERLIGEPLGIFLSSEPLLGDDGKPIAPIVRSKITDRGQIEGLSLTEATLLSGLLNAGRIPLPLTPVYDQTVSPILGADFIEMSIKAGIIGIILVMLFMMAYYRLSGALASLALIFYGVLVLAIFKLIPVTLTLAGLGGFILSIGMAVDANVLIFERMKEEIRTGRTLGAAIEAGFNRAWTAIRDSNVTTFIACGILYWVGNSVAAGAPVKGFALTLFIGVAVSMFTAITVTRTLLRLFVGSRLSRKTSLFSVSVGKKDA